MSSPLLNGVSERHLVSTVDLPATRTTPFSRICNKQKTRSFSKRNRFSAGEGHFLFLHHRPSEVGKIKDIRPTCH